MAGPVRARGGASPGAGRGRGGVGWCGACPGRSLCASCRRCGAGPHGGAAGAALLQELLSGRGGTHFRVRPGGVWRPRRGPGRSQVSRGACLPGPARAEELGSRWAAGPGGGGAARGRAGAAL